MTKLQALAIAAGLAIGGGIAAYAADSSERENPQDAKPQCLERDASSAECVVPSDQTGTRRIFYPPGANSGASAGASSSGSAGTTSGGTALRSGPAAR